MSRKGSKERLPSWKARPGGEHREARPKPDWLSRALSRAGILPLEEAEDAIRAGRISMNGRVVEQPLALVAPGALIRLDGHRISLEVKTYVLAFHKPAELLSSTARQHGVGTVFEVLLPQLPRELAGFHWHAVGRLDRDTTGLLLFTNDERFLAFATSPERGVPKRYLAEVLGGADDAKVAPLRRGVALEDGRTRPAQVEVTDARHVVVTVTEGRNHQVKRMLGAVGLPTRTLHREAIGSVTLDVPEGRFRLLTEEEVRDGLGYRGPESGAGLQAPDSEP